MMHQNVATVSQLAEQVFLLVSLRLGSIISMLVSKLPKEEKKFRKLKLH